MLRVLLPTTAQLWSWCRLLLAVWGVCSGLLLIYLAADSVIEWIGMFLFRRSMRRELDRLHAEARAKERDRMETLTPSEPANIRLLRRSQS